MRSRQRADDGGLLRDPRNKPASGWQIDNGPPYAAEASAGEGWGTYLILMYCYHLIRLVCTGNVAAAGIGIWEATSGLKSIGET